jgi:hypothetical protein
MKEREIKIDEQALKALFEGKRARICLSQWIGEKSARAREDRSLSPRYGFFITHESRAELEKRIYGHAFEEAVRYLRTLAEDDKREILESDLI